MAIFGQGHEIVTSLTRPSSPTTGQMIYETDTSNFRWYTGSGWAGVTPVGTLSVHAGATAPTGWLLCYGQSLNAVATPAYADLYSVIGTTYGGSANTAFNLPDLRGRRTHGKDDMGGSAANRLTVFAATSLNASGGSEFLQTHAHSYSGSGSTGNDSPDHGHAWTLMSAQGGRDGNDGPARAINGWDPNFRTGGSSSGGYGGATAVRHTHNWSWSMTTTSTGSGGSANMPPTIVLNYIIKY
jgi:microcystin-dependent protein